jgi:hypothetical protein
MPGGDQAGQLAGVPRQRQELEGRVRDCRVLALVLERANLQDAAADERMSCDEFDRLCHVLALQQVKTQKGALSLQERAFGNLALAVLYPHGDRSCFGREFTSRDPRSPAVHRRYPLCDGLASRGRRRRYWPAYQHQESHRGHPFASDSSNRKALTDDPTSCGQVADSR